MTQAALAAKLVRISAALGWQKKAGDGPGYKYVEASRVFAEVRTELQKENVAFTMSTTDFQTGTIAREGKGPQFTAEIAGDYCFIDGDSGDVITGRYVGFGIDTAGKALWAAITGAMKYIFITVLLLPTGDDPEATDSGADEARPAVRTNGPTPPPATRAGSDRLTPAQIVKLKASLGDAGLKTDDQKREFTKAVLSSPVGSKQMTPAQMDQILAAITEQPLVLEAARAFG